jgi:hypothetical protein
MDGNVNNVNHLIHFLVGMVSYKYYYVTPIFIIYQLIDGFKFKYKVVREGPSTDDIPLDFLFFSLGELSMRYFMKLFGRHI